MAKRKRSPFERINLEEMDRKQRRELGRRLEKSDPGLEIVHRDAAGNDVGNQSHYVAVPGDRDSQPVREFGCRTSDLVRMAEWLKECRIPETRYLAVTRRRSRLEVRSLDTYGPVKAGAYQVELLVPATLPRIVSVSFSLSSQDIT